MRNKYNSFYRTDEISREPNKRVSWLDSLAEKMAVEEQASKFDNQIKNASKTAVEVSRDRNIGPSVYEMMSAIVSGPKPKFSSVEEAVKDYQERTGLSQYLKAQTEEQKAALASVIVQAGDHEDCGNADCAECADASNADDEDEADVADTEDDKESLSDIIEMFLSPKEDKDDMSVPDLDMAFDLKKKL